MEAVTIENSRIRDDDASKVVAAEDMLRDEIVMRCALFVCVWSSVVCLCCAFACTSLSLSLYVCAHVYTNTHTCVL